jgi:hypothetical protein
MQRPYRDILEGPRDLTEAAKTFANDPKKLAAANKVLAKYGMELKEIMDGFFDLRGPSTAKSAPFWWNGQNAIWIQYDKGQFSIRGSVDSSGTTIQKMESDVKAASKIMKQLAKAVPESIKK